jgi:hypothetical protein
MDGSFGKEGNRHADFHGGKDQPPDITWDAGRVTYRTSKIMSNAVAETINTAKNFPIITIWHGDGLTQALIREANLPNACCIDETEKRKTLSLKRPVVVANPIAHHQGSFWDVILDTLIPSDLPELISNIAVCEPRRAIAKYNTGTIPFESAAYLRALCRVFSPEIIVEVGTFIGTSTLALNPRRAIYTCDERNDCVPSKVDNDPPNIITHPYRSSTQMLRDIQEKVDLFFFDGRIQQEDLPHIQRLSKSSTIYVVDDYVGKEKGVANVELLAPLVHTHTLITPGKGPSTLAAIIPGLRVDLSK